MTRLYSILGLSTSADSVAIKRAYRKKAAKTHPDRAGGDKESFQLVQKAYAILSDPARRRQYDQTGDDEAKPDDHRAKCLSTLAQLVLQVVEQCRDLEHEDLKHTLKVHINSGQSTARTNIAQMRTKIKRYEIALKRFKSKRGKAYITSMLQAQLRANERLIEQLEDNIQMGEEMLKILEDYEYEVDEQPTTIRFSGHFVDGTGAQWSFGNAT